MAEVKIHMDYLNGEEGRGGAVDVHPCGTTAVDVIRARLDSTPNQEDPFFVVDLSRLATLHNRWSSELPNVHPFYAVKCNSDPVVLSVLASLGCGFDCASRAEVQAVLDLGVAPDKIIYANPCKQSSHIRFSASRDVLKVTFDNEIELRKMSHCHPSAELLVRIRADDPDAMCNLGVKFGASVSQACHLLDVAVEMGLNVVGVCFHVGSGCQNSSAYRRAIEMAHEVFTHGKGIGLDLTVLDIGGGFPGHRGSEGHFSEIAFTIRSALAEWFEEGKVEVIAEPGRYFATSTHTLAVCVTSKRVETTEDNKKRFMYYINDGVYGSFSCIVFGGCPNRSPRLLTPPTASCHLYECSLWGPTCDGIDQIFDCGTLPELLVGEWLVFEDMGAYTASAATSFNGFQRPRSFYYATEEQGHKRLVTSWSTSVGSACRSPVSPSGVPWLLDSLPQQPPNPEQLCTS